MSSNGGGPWDPGDPGGDLPPHLDPRGDPRRGRHGRSSRQNPGRPLPPELDPRGRRAARRRPAASRSEPASRPQPTRQRTRRTAPGSSRSDVLHGMGLGVRVLAAALSLLILVGSGWAWALYRNFNGNLVRINAITNDSQAAKKNIDGTAQNILIAGNDDRSTATDAELAELGTTRDGGSLNTDTMMLLHVPADGSKATVISFPRDSYVEIPGHGKDKLNAAYPLGVQDAGGDKSGGARLLVTTLEDLTGLKIDHFVQVDLLGFVRISDAIGGVDVCLNNAVDDPYSQLNLPAGHSTIEGKNALAFVRQRHGLPDGDLDRIKRQQYFLSAVFRKMSSAGTLLNPFKLQKLLKAISSSLQMDNNLDPMKLAQQMQNLTAGNLTFTTIPTEGTADVDVGNVVVVDSAALPDFVDNLIGVGPSEALASAKPAPAGSFDVEVLNGSGVNGRATENTAALKTLGFNATVSQGDPGSFATTTIEYPKGMEGAAKTLQAQVPGATMDRTTQVSSVTLVLGANNIQVKTLMPAPTAPSTSAPTPSGTGNTVTTAADAGCIN